MLEEILPARREIWAEKLLLTILWLEAGADAARGALARDLTVLAHELVLGRRALAALPAMVEIAKRSLYVAGVQRW